MLKIKNNVIYLTRGDSAKIKINISDMCDNPFVYAGSTVITFSAKKKILDKDYVIQKIILNNNYIELSPNDTKDLDFGKYIYDVQIVFDGKTHTVIPPSSLYICEEVTV